MRAYNIRILSSPLDNTAMRLEAEVCYETPGLKNEFYWIDIPLRRANSISLAGNPWLVCLAPLAMTLGEVLHVSAPVDARLLENVRELSRIWKAWYPELNEVEFHVDPGVMSPDKAGRGQRRIAAFFSGGVDSFFTLLRHEQGGEYDSQRFLINDLLLVHGFDIPLENKREFEELSVSLLEAARFFKKDLVCVATNIRKTQWQKVKWAELGYGACLAATGLALEPGYSKFLIPSSFGPSYSGPRGSHLLTDPLFSTAYAEFIHDGAVFRRTDKMRLVSKSDVALSHLRVCCLHGLMKNCGFCSKCFRTMMALYMLGVHESARTFSWENFTSYNLSRIYIPRSPIRSFMLELLSEARNNGFQDLIRAINLSLIRSDFVSFFLPFAAALRKIRYVWRFADPLERFLMRGFVH